MNLDMINGGFELAAGLLTLLTTRALLRDKKVRGVSPIPLVLFTAWGFFNLAYYPSLDQWFSFLGSCVIVAVNVVNLTLMWSYRKN